MKRLILTACVVASLSACTTNPKNIGSAYVSPLKYQDYTCDQMTAEMATIERRVNSTYAHLKKENSKDKWATGVGVVLFWPALFFLAGNDNVKEAEYAQLKGDYEALQATQVRNNCVSNTVAPVDEYEAMKARKN